MKVYISRDSTCAADDVTAPNSRQFEIPAGTEVDQFISHVCAAFHLPQISGGHATWVLSSSVPLAVVAQQWSQPIPVFPFGCKLADFHYGDAGELRAHWSYLAQVDPIVTVDVVRRLRLRP